MKILIAEDDPVSRRVLEANLVEWGYDVMIASDGSEAWELLQKPGAPNLVISDWMMPHMDGLELCRRIRQMERSGYTYFIILTAKGRKEDIIEGLEAGADDFLIKPFDRQELKYRAKIGERIINLELRILELANTDALTGVLNRRAFMERMEQEIHRSLREGVPFSLILTDIDYFKRVNDRHGHQVGDLVLQRFTERLSESSRPYDFVGRYGGEEFVVCLPGADISQAGSVAERMRRRVEEMRITLPDSSQSIRITGSFGVASFRAGSEETVDLITGRADDTMYRAKREGRNRVCVASEAGH
jgi:two-component system cell cycle response regulator